MKNANETTSNTETTMNATEITTAMYRALLAGHDADVDIAELIGCGLVALGRVIDAEYKAERIMVGIMRHYGRDIYCQTVNISA